MRSGDEKTRFGGDRDGLVDFGAAGRGELFKLLGVQRRADIDDEGVGVGAVPEDPGQLRRSGLDRDGNGAAGVRGRGISPERYPVDPAAAGRDDRRRGVVDLLSTVTLGTAYHRGNIEHQRRIGFVWIGYPARVKKPTIPSLTVRLQVTLFVFFLTLACMYGSFPDHFEH
jgi:hypothetical protein